MDNKTQALIKDVLALYYKFNKGLMELNKPLRKLLFTVDKDPTGEKFIRDFQDEMETVIKRHTKKSLTLRKGIPYSMCGIDEFIKNVMEELQ